MSIQFESLTDEETSEVLLAYVKNRLAEGERKSVEAAAEKSPEIAEEIAYYSALSAAMDGAEQDAAPGELGWARLSRALDEADRTETATISVPESANDNNRGWRYAAMALGLVVLAQFGMQFMSQEAPEDPARYIPVSQTTAEFSVQMTLSPDATETMIRGLLLSAEANIIAGPSALGVYQVGFADEAALESGLAELQAATGIVESASAQ